MDERKTKHVALHEHTTYGMLNSAEAKKSSAINEAESVRVCECCYGNT